MWRYWKHYFKCMNNVVVEEMESEEEETMVSVAGKMVPLNEVTDEMVSKMSPEEKEEYIRLGQELYQNMYE